MAKNIERAVQFWAKNDTLSTDAHLHCIRYEHNERIKRAGLRLGLCWIASAASLPIIIAHWVLVPGFFIAGPLLAIQTYRKEEIISHASGTCPLCDQQIKIELEANEQLPVWRQCPNCGNTIHIND
jgi:hypothetical protein